MNGDLRAILPVYMAFLSKQKVGKDSRYSCVTEKKVVLGISCKDDKNKLIISNGS